MYKKAKLALSALLLIILLCIAESVFAATYKYDDLNRLVEVIYDSGQKITYTYDAGGNILNIEVSMPLKLNPIGDKTVNVGNMLQFTVSVGDLEGVQPIYSAYNLPEGAVFDSNTGTFTWMPNETQAGEHKNIRFEAAVGTTVASEEITITVNSVNTPTGENIELVSEENGVSIEFENVEASGNTSITLSDSLPEEITSEVNLIPIYYDIVTDAEFTGGARIKVSYDASKYEADENALRLYQVTGG